MEALFKNFDIPYHAITGLLQVFDGCIAGSSVLHSYLSQTEELSWEPNDIDIWIPIPGLTKLQCKDRLHDYNDEDRVMIRNLQSMKHVIDNVLDRYGFKIAGVNDYTDDEVLLSREELKCIQRVSIRDYTYFKESLNEIIYNIRYYRKNNKMIQVIFTSDIPRKEVLENFDMTICRIAWDPQTQFTTPSPSVFEDIKHKRAIFAEKLVKLRSGKMEGFSEKQMKRINKYLERGFQICLPVEK